MIITASDVRLSLAGFTLSGPGCSDFPIGIPVAPGLSNVWIERGAVTGVTAGIYLAGSNSRISGVTLTDHCYVGIYVQGSSHVVASNVVVGSLLGIALAGPGNTVHSNHVIGNGQCGVCALSDGATIYGNTVTSNGTGGQAHSGGIVVDGRDNRVGGNVAIRNFHGISLGESSRGTDVRGNTTTSNLHGGIVVAAGSTPNDVVGNTAFSNGAIDLADGNHGCGANRWRRNVFKTDWVAGASESGPAGGCIR